MTTITFEQALERMNLAQPHADMFDTHAQAVASELADAGGKGSNRSSQIRRFYDELLRFEQSLRGRSQADFDKALPFIRMINARAAYASQRKSEGGTLVSEEFTQFLRALLAQVTDHQTLRHACMMFEAVIGFSAKEAK